MKKLTILLAALGMILVGCNNKDNWAPGPVAPKNAQPIFFPITEDLGIEMDPSDPFTEWEIAVARYDSTEIYPATTVGIRVLKNTNNAYTVPATLTFEEGEAEATLTVAVGEMAVGETYELAVTFTADNFNPYLDIDQIGGGIAAGSGCIYAMSICPIGWSEIKTGVWVDGFIDDWFGTEFVPFYVEYQTVELPGNVFRIRARDVYARAGNGEDPDEYGIFEAFPDIFDDELVEGTFNLIIDIDAKGNAFLQQGELGFDWGYGNMIVRSTNTPGVWDGEHLFFSGEDKTLVTCMPEYSTSFYYCGSDVEFFASREAFLEYYPEGETAPKRQGKQARQIRR